MTLPRIAVFSGPRATIQNTPPLLRNVALRSQRLAAPAVLYVDRFSAHPLEADSAELYGPPDGYLDLAGTFHGAAGATPEEGWRPVMRVEIAPEDGLLLLPYAARTRDGRPWEDSGLTPGAPEPEQRQTFYPDASRLYEEIDRFGLDESGGGYALSRAASFDFYRAIPSGGYRKGLAAADRTDVDAWDADTDLPPERAGVDYFAYAPPHLATEPHATELARATNIVQRVLSSGRYLGGQWLEGSPTAEESLYWFNLLLDVSVPLVGHVAQRRHGTISADGDRNIVDGVEYLISRVWADDTGRDTLGVVMIVDQRIFAARDVAKTDARPGNYVATGGSGGALGVINDPGGAVLRSRPVHRSTSASELRLTQLPMRSRGVRRQDGVLRPVQVDVRNGAGGLRPSAMPAVTIVKYGRYGANCCGENLIDDLVNHAVTNHALAGVIGEGVSPYGSMDPASDRALTRAVFSGLPVVKCGRGNTGGFARARPRWVISGGDLTSTKARILLMAALLKLGSLPPSADPDNPTEREQADTATAVAKYQRLFDTH